MTAAQARWEREHPEGRQKRERHARQDAREFVAAAKAGKPCVDCGIEYPTYVMDFDHRDGTDKVCSVARMVSQGWSLPRIAAEIAKCDLRCANCHRIKTWSPEKRRGRG